MKKLFTLLFALMSVTAIFAQTPAQEMTNSSFKGSAVVTINGSKKTVNNQTVDFALTSDPKCVDVTLSSGSFKYTIITITMIPDVAKNVEVSKSGNAYTLDSSKTFKLTLDNGSAQSQCDAQFSKSSIDIVGKKATFTLHLTNLSSTIQSVVGSYLDVDYTMDLTSYVTAISNVTTEKQANGKFLKDGKVVILNNGSEYNTNGQLVK